MEFPEVGNHCSVNSCKQLDFLPIQCAACHQLFCRDHYTFEQHNCPSAYSKDNQVPVCPLCTAPIPIRPGEYPDQKVSQHIDTNCQSQPAKDLKGKIFKNRCSFANCRKKELVPFVCPECKSNFCLTHRHESDHACRGSPAQGNYVLSRSGAAAIWRAARSLSNDAAASSSRPHVTNKEEYKRAQNGMSDQEALRLALLASQNSGQPSNKTAQNNQMVSAGEQRRRQEESDRALAEALAASEQEERTRQLRQQNRQNNQSNSNPSCRVS